MEENEEQEYPFEFFLGIFEYLSRGIEDAFYANDDALKRYYQDGWAFLSRFINEAWGR